MSSSKTGSKIRNKIPLIKLKYLTKIFQICNGKEWYSNPRDESFEFYTVVVDYNNRQFWGGGANSEGIRVYDGDEMTVYSELFGESINVLSLALDSQNTKWIGTMKSIIRYDDSDFTQVISFESGLFGVFDIEIDEDGSVWFVVSHGSGKTILAKYTPEDSTTAVEIEPLPEEITLHQARPNPFNPRTTIQYEIPFDEQVKLVIYDILGREITVLQYGMMSAGIHNAVWDGRNSDGELTGSGVYIYQLVAGEHKAQGKMLLLR